MNWNGEYRIRCPKCGCRKIWVTEHTDAYSEHLVDNGEWKHEYDNNDYGEILYTDFCCDSCGHKWRRHLSTIDSYIFDDKPKRKKNLSFKESVELLKKLSKTLEKD